MEEKKNQAKSKKVVIGLLVLLLVLSAATGVALLTKMKSANAEAVSDNKLRKQLADASVTEIVLSEKVGVSSPMEVNGNKTITGKGTLVATTDFSEGEQASLLIVTDGASLTLGGSVVVDAKGVDYGVYAEQGSSLTLSEEAMLKNAAQSNIYSFGEVTQSGAQLESGYDNVYIAEGGSFLWESGSNRLSVNHGIHIEEGAALKVTSKDAEMRESGSHGIYLHGEAEIEDILLIMSGGNQIDVAATGVLVLNGGDIAYGVNNGIGNQGKLTVNGGAIYNSTYCGIVNAGEAELQAGSVRSNGKAGVLNRNGGKLTILSDKVSINSNTYGVSNDENAVCELAYATVRSNKTNNVLNYGEIHVHDIKLEASGNNSVVTCFGGHTFLENVVIDGTGKNHGILNSYDGVVELDHVTIMNTAKRGIQNQKGEVKGSYVTFENITTAAIGSTAHKQYGGGTITLDHVETKNCKGNSLYLDGGGAGTVYISDSTFGATGSNNVSVKKGEAYLTNVKILGHQKGVPDTAHGVYLSGGKLQMTDCMVSHTAGSAIRNNGGDVEIKRLTVSDISVHNVFASAGTTTLTNSTLAATGYHHIYSKGGKVTLDNCTLEKGVTSCVSVKEQGDVAVKNSTLGATIANNVTVTGGAVTLENAKILGNMSGSADGVHGVYATAGTVTIKNSLVSHTTGSAIRNNGGAITITGLTVDDITVHNIFASGGTTDIKDSTLAASDYHHIYCRGGKVTVDKCVLEEGADSTLSVPKDGVVEVANSTLGATSVNNITVTGGTVTLENTSVLGNLPECGDGVHGIYATAGTVTLRNTSISHTSGSAIRNDGGDITAIELSVDDITGHNVFASGGSTTVKDSKLAASDYHHIYCRGGKVTVDSSVLKEGADSTLSVPTGGVVEVVNSTLGATSVNNITVTGGRVTLENTSVLGNLPECGDGVHGVYTTAGTVTLTNTSISHTTGSAIRNAGGTVTATGLRADDVDLNNIFASGGTTKLKDSTLGATMVNNIKVTGGAVTLENTSVLGNLPECGDGVHGVYATAGTITLTNSTISNVTGSAIRNDGGVVTATGLSVDNIAVNNIFASMGTTDISNSTLTASGNYHIYCRGGNVTADNCELKEGATASLSVPTGGTVKVTNSTLGATKANNVTVTGGTVTLENTSILGNVPESGTGTHGVYATAGTVTLTNSSVSHATGSAIRNNGGTITAIGLRTENNAQYNVFTSKGTTDIKDSTLCAVETQNVRVTGGTVTLEKTSVLGTLATGTRGIALIVNTAGTVELKEGVELSGAQRAVWNNATMSMDGVKIRDNGDADAGTTDGIEGTGIYNIGTLTMKNTEVSNNYSETGVIFLAKDSALTVEDSVFSGNTGDGSDVLMEGLSENSELDSQLTLKGLVQTNEIRSIQKDACVKLDGALDTGSYVVLDVEETIGTLVAKSDNAENMLANLAYLEVSEDLAAASLTLEIDKEHPEQAVLCIDPTPGNVARVGETEYATLQEAINAVADVAQNKATVEIIRTIYLTDTVNIPDNYNITIKDDGARIRKIARSNAWTEDEAMFSMGAGATLSFATTGHDTENESKLIVDGNHSLTGTTLTRLVEIPAGVIVNVGSGVKVCNHKTEDASAVGGAFLVKGGTLNITGGIFDGNQSPSGGVIATTTASSGVNITGGTFTNNKATANHGGVFRLDAITELLIENAIFERNTAASQGGVMRVQNKEVNVIVKNCTFESNSAAAYGGVISNMSRQAATTILLEGNTFRDNTAASGGSAINLNGAVTGVTIKNNEFISNGVDLRVDNAGAQVNLSGKNSLETLLYGTAALNINAEFDPDSRISIICQNPADGNVVVKCPTEDNAKAWLSCFTAENYVLEVSGSNLVLRQIVARIGENTYTTLQDAVNAAKDVTDNKVTIEIMGDVSLTSTVTILEGYDITIKDDGAGVRTISRGSAWTEDAPMFSVGAGATLSFASTGNDEENGSKLIVDGNHSLTETTLTRLAEIPEGVTVNVGSGVKVCNHKTTATTPVGGAFLVTGGTLNITGGIFDGNQSASGGVIATTSNGSTVNITGGKFTNNKATVNVGGVFRIDAITELLIENAIFEGNTAKTEGGVIRIQKKKTTLTIRNSRFASNQANYGGVLSTNCNVAGSTALLEGNTFNNNVATQGSVMNLDKSTMTFTLQGGNTFVGDVTDICMNRTTAPLKLSGENSFKVYLNTANAMNATASLQIMEDFDTKSEITLISSVVQVAGEVVATCLDAEANPSAYLNCFKLSTNLSGFTLDVSGGNLVLK